MAAAITGTYMSASQGTGIAFGTIALTGSYVSGGDTLDLTKYAWQSLNLVTTQNPIMVIIVEVPVEGTAGSGYTFIYASGTTLATGGVQVFQGGTQLSAGAYPAAITGAVINARIEFYTGV